MKQTPHFWPLNRPLWCSLSLLTSFVLAACGGGGGGGGTSEGPNQLPLAVAKLSGEAVANGNTVLDSSASTDADGVISSRTWAYGDGQSGGSDSHVYTTVGNYTATLTVTDNRGGQSSATVAVKVVKCSAAGTSAATLSPYPSVCVQTSKGELVFEVYPKQAPLSAANFLAYVDDGFYSGVLFHRVIPGFVIQGGGYTPGPVVKAATRAAIALESNNGLKNWAYTLAMARTNLPNSATSQFFINLVDNPGLDYSAAVSGPNGYAVFGQVISGTAVVDAIAAAPTGAVPAAGLTDVPTTDVVIRSIVRMP